MEATTETTLILQLAKWVGALGLVAQFAMLAMQAAMLRRHGHNAFLWLCLSSLIGALYIVVSVAPYFLPLEERVVLALYVVSVLLFAMGALMSLLGTRMLFRAYDRLAERADAHGAGA
ncbi:MAG: hypothetical protein ACOY82_07365 [Pseudomonadota bacterium]